MESIYLTQNAATSATPVKVGRTVFHPIFLGQDASSVRASSGGRLRSIVQRFSVADFFEGEIVIVITSDGRKLIGRVGHKTGDLIPLHLGHGVVWRIPPSSFPTLVGKLIGAFYVATDVGVVPQAIGGGGLRVQLGSSQLSPLAIGDLVGPQFQKLSNLDHTCYQAGEPIALLNADRRTWSIAEIQSIKEDSVILLVAVGLSNQERSCHPTEVPALVSKLVGPYYLAAISNPSAKQPTGSAHSASELQEHSRKDVRAQIEQGFHRRTLASEGNIHRVFDQYKTSVEDSNFGFIPKDKLPSAFSDLGVIVHEGAAEEFFNSIDLNGDGYLDFDEFKTAILSPSPVEAWAHSLPLAGLLADALPRPYNACKDPVRIIGTLTDDEINVITEELGNGLRRLLLEHVKRLREAYRLMDVQTLRSLNKKFEVASFNCGKIEDFHSGLEKRIGTCDLNFESGMEIEHCMKPGNDKELESTNYHIRFTPKSEWGIVVCGTPCPNENMKHGRTIPNVNDLLQIKLAKDAELLKAEVIAIVLYTGPMFQVYNTVLRRHPDDQYQFWKSQNNFFPTTIFVLVSAIQKISRSMKLPDGLRLYRGLGGNIELPDWFFKSDDNGCKGLVDWGFMSTTSEKKVAIAYSGINDKPMPLVLSLRVGGVDRGACIKEFSQYQNEVEYLYVPCSFLEQDGPRSLEVTEDAVVSIIPVKINSNLKSLTVEELVGKKKQIHISAFERLIDEIERKLFDIAHKKENELRKRFLRDSSRDEQKHSIDGFLKRIVEQCKEVMARHQSSNATTEYTNDNAFQKLVLEMVDVKSMAIAKLEEWMENESGSFLRFRWNAALRTVHRRWVTYLERQIDSFQDDDKKKAAIRLCQVKRLIVESVEEKNELNETRLMAAAAEGSATRHLKLLVDAGADVNTSRPDGVTAVWLAAQFGHKECINALAEMKANVDQPANDGATPLYIAAQSGNVDCIRTLQILGCNINNQDKNGLTAIHQAAMNGHDACIKVLKEGQIDKPANDGATPLYIAAQKGNDNCIKALASLGADVNAADTNGSTPVHQAASNGHDKCIVTLQTLGADINRIDKAGFAPVHRAAMNGHDECIRILHSLRADVHLSSTKDDVTPLVLATQKGHDKCIETLARLVAELPRSRKNSCENIGNSASDYSNSLSAGIDAAAKQEDDRAGSEPSSEVDGRCVESIKQHAAKSVARRSSAVYEPMRKLIISTGDISDIDGFYALAEYAKTGADVLFVMNYPAYVGVAESDADNMYAENNPGLGFKYSAKDVLAAVEEPADSKYMKFMARYSKELVCNDLMKRALTDLAFWMACNVWTEVSAGHGKLMFCIGGINAVNPFSAKSVKNEVLVYSALIRDETQVITLDTKEGLKFDQDGNLCEVMWSEYSEIFMDFNGSMSFWNEWWWANNLSSPNVASRVKGVFIMGGVYADRDPITMPSIPNVLNRFSSATMNQLYHPQRTADFFAFLKHNNFTAYTVTNNVVSDLTTWADEGKTEKTYVGIDKFLGANGLDGAFLTKFAKVHYNSKYNPPRRAFDYHTAMALTTLLRDGKELPTSPKKLFYSNVYGMTLVSNSDSWEMALVQYLKVVDTTVQESDSPFIKAKKENFAKEIKLMSSITFAPFILVKDLKFELDYETSKLKIVDSEGAS